MSFIFVWGLLDYVTFHSICARDEGEFISMSSLPEYNVRGS